jgi:TatA/E family protein of Tat protein translocase
MFGMGMPEILLILAIALIVIGPKKLPDLAKSMGKAFGEFKRATQDFKQALDVQDDLRSVKRTFDDIDLNKLADSTSGKGAETPADSAAGASASQADAQDAETRETAPPREENGSPKDTDSASAASEKDAGADRHA